MTKSKFSKKHLRAILCTLMAVVIYASMCISASAATANYTGPSQVNIIFANGVVTNSSGEFTIPVGSLIPNKTITKIVISGTKTTSGVFVTSCNLISTSNVTISTATFGTYAQFNSLNISTAVNSTLKYKFNAERLSNTNVAIDAVTFDNVKIAITYS